MKGASSEAFRYLNNARVILRHVHIAGYYRGLLRDRKVVRDALDAAGRFIKKVA